ncbi:MAG: hypothetical protein ACR2HN_05340 [Tepidiformaceae bacterium]
MQQRLNRWLRERPAAPLGDGEGTPASWPRRNRIERL